MYQPTATIQHASVSRAERIANAGQPWREILWLMSLWTVAPFLLRCVTIWQNTTEHSSFLATLGIVLARAVAVLPQDLWIAAECVLVLWVLKVTLVNSIAGEWGERVASVLATTMFAAMQAYVLYDYLLFWKTGVRLDYTILSSIAPAELLNTSTTAVGFLPLICSAGAMLTLIAYAGKQLREHVSAIQLTRHTLAAFALIAIAACGSHWLTPNDAGYVTNNVLLTDQVNYTLGAFRRDAEPMFTFDTKTVLAALRANERFDANSPDHPLYKETRGFLGQAAFEVRIPAAERPHVIFLQLESFRSANVGVLGAKHPASPNFDELSKHGILFTQFYSNGVLPFRGSTASMFGIPPRFMPSSLASTKPGIPLVGIADVFHQVGYRNSLFYGGLIEIENMGEFFRRHGFDDVQGVNDVLKAFPQAWRSAWGIHDEFLIHHMVNQLERQDKSRQPSVFYVQSSSNRRPWQLPNTYQPLKLDQPIAGEYADYLRTFHYSDACLGLLMKSLREKGLDKKTILFVYGSTGMPMGEHQENYSPINYAYEENFRVPLLILAPGRIDNPTVIHEVGSQMDLLPTVMDLFGLTGPNHALGSSLARRIPDRLAIMNNPFGSQYLAIRQGDFKYIYSLRSQSAQLFNLKSDPTESTNVIAEHTTLAQRYHAQVMGLNQLLSRHFLSETLVPTGAVEREAQ